MKVLDSSPPLCEQRDRNLCYSVAMLVHIFHALLMLTGKNRENSLSRGSLSTVVFFSRVWHVCMCLEHTACFSGSWRLFQIVLVPREHCACVSHMSNLSLAVCAALCRGYRVQGWALPSFCTARGFLTWLSLVRRVPAESCWLAAVSWIPPSVKLPTCDFVYIESKVPCFTGSCHFVFVVFFLQCFSSVISSDLSPASWLRSSAEVIRAEDSSSHTRIHTGF